MTSGGAWAECWDWGKSALARFPAQAAFGLGASGVVNVLLLCSSFYAQHVYDRVLPHRDVVELAVLTVVVCGGSAVLVATEFFRARWIRSWCHGFVRWLDRTAFETARVLRQGEPLRHAARIRRLLLGGAVAALLDGAWIPVYLVAALAFHPAIGLFAVLGVGLMSVSASCGEAAMRAPRHRLEQAEQRRLALMAHALSARHVPSARRWEELSAVYFEREAEAGLGALRVGAAARLVRLVLQSGGLALGALAVIEGSLTIGGLVASTVILARTFALADQVLAHWRGAAGALQSLAALTRPIPAPGGSPQILNSSMFATAPRRASDHEADSFLKYSSSWPIRFSRLTSRVSRS